MCESCIAVSANDEELKSPIKAIDKPEIKIFRFMPSISQVNDETFYQVRLNEEYASPTSASSLVLSISAATQS
jgi:hypothetical protein